jgi:DNA-binding transcriptional MerR regulator
MYTRDDILKLQQIIFLKSFGFSLDEINGKILRRNASTGLEEVFAQQREILLEQIGNLNKIVSQLDTVISESKTGTEISLDKLMTIMELMKQGNPYSFVIRYFGDEQLKNVTNRFDSSDEYKLIMDHAKELFAQLDNLYNEGADPAGKEGQELAARWWKMVGEFTAGDPSLLKPLLSAGMDVGNWPEETKGFQDAIEHFLGKAISIYLNNNGIYLTEMEAGNDE